MLKSLIILITSAMISSEATGWPNRRFTTFEAKDGFPMVAVSSITQDGQDNIWFSCSEGTGGLFKYDGYDCRQVEFDDFTMACNDSLGRIWAVGICGIALYSGGKGGIAADSHCIPARSLSLMAPLPGGRLLVSNRVNFWVFDPEDRSFSETEGILPSGQIAEITVNRNGKVWIGTRSGMVLSVDPSTLMPTVVTEDLGSRINDILPDGDSLIWIATQDGGVVRWDMRSSRMLRIEKGNSLNSLPSNTVRALCHENQNTLWIGTANGLAIMDKESLRMDIFRRDFPNRNSISGNSVLTLFRDSQGGMWLSTFYGGVNYWHPSERRFRNIVKSESGLNDDIVNTVIKDPSSRLWIGTHTGGLNMLDMNTGDYSHYRTRGYLHDTRDVKAIYPDPDGKYVWIGTHRSPLLRLDTATGVLEEMDTPIAIYDIIPEGNEKLWLGAIPGLFLYDIRSGTVTRKRRRSSMVLMKDSRGKLWVGGNTSLTKYDISGDYELKETDLSITSGIGHTSDLFEDSKGNIWVTTGGSLLCNRYGQAENGWTITIPDRRTGRISGIEEDSKGGLWLGTGKGIYRFDPVTGECLRFTSADGLAGDCFLMHSHFKAPDGEMFFGGLEGISIFHPSELKDERLCPPPVISELLIHGETVKFNPEKTFVIKPREKHIEFIFTTPDYISVGTNSFQYKLEGFNDRWYDTTSDRKASFSNLPKGSYHLKVRASAQGGEWVEMANPLSIRVLPKWYRTTFARICFVLLTIAAIALAYVVVSRRRELEHQLELRELDKKYENELRKAKTLSFINSGALSGKHTRTGKVITELNSADEKFLYTAIRTVEDNMSVPEFDSDTLAEALSVSRMTLHNRIKAITGQSTLQFIHKIRFTEACRLLKETMMSISEIGYAIGYRNSQTFCSAFKSYVGCTAGEYRKN